MVLYPGDIWIPYKSHNNSALRSTRRIISMHYKTLNDNTKKYNLNLLKQKSLEYKEKIIKKNIFLKIFKPKATIIWVKDLKKSIKFDLKDGITSVKISRKYCDIEMASDLIFGWLNFDYGGASAYISARMLAIMKLTEAHTNIFTFQMVIIEVKLGRGLFLKEELKLESSKHFIKE